MDLVSVMSLFSHVINDIIFFPKKYLNLIIYISLKTRKLATQIYPLMIKIKR